MPTSKGAWARLFVFAFSFLLLLPTGQAHATGSILNKNVTPTPIINTKTSTPANGVSAFASLAAAAATTTDPSFDQGYVSLTFDDGLLNQYQNALPILTAGNVKGSFYIITHTAGMGIANANLDTPDAASSTKPSGWTPSGGNAKFTYPVAGQSGNAAEVSSTVTKSNAAWTFPTMTVLADEDYVYADAYRSTATSDLVIQMTDASGTLSYINSSGDAVSTLTPAKTFASTNGAWVNMPSFLFYVPVNIVSITVMHRLTGVGLLDIDNVSLGASTDFMTPTQVRDLQAKGMEVGGHTQTHPDLATLTDAQQQAEIVGGRQELLNNGLTPVSTFVYPYGSYNASTLQIVKQAGYVAARTVSPGYNDRASDLTQLLAQSVTNSTTAADIEGWIDQARANHQWLIIIFHPIVANISNEEYGATPQTLQAVVNYLNTNKVPVITMLQGEQMIANGPQVNHAPTANNAAVTTLPNTPVAITLTAADVDNNPLTYSIVTPPAHGTISGTAPNITYTPASGFSGLDSFTFKANDGLADSNVATVNVTVSATQIQSNLVLNPSFVTPDPNNPGYPLHWTQGGWGTNVATYTYPVTGHTDAYAAKVQMTSYSSGDNKWVFDPVAVIPGHTYTYTDAYEANISSIDEVEFTSTTGTLTYVGATSFPASASKWATSTLSFTAPVNAASVRVYHYITGVGWLTIDDVSVVDQASTPPPPAPTVVITPTSIASGTTTTAYSQTLTASTTATGTFTWSVSNGSLPAGLTLGASTDLTNTISGTPTTAGTANFSIRVTNGTSSTTQAFSVTINAAATTTPPAPGISITPTSLGNGTTTTSFLQTLTASTAATGTFTWSVSSGSLPAGLSLGTSTGKTNTIAGTPTTAGTSNFSIRVTNGTSSTTQAFAMTIFAAATSTPTTTNLVLNPSFVTPDPANPGNPLHWIQGGWGTNTPVFTYPVTGRTDAYAAKAQITAYTSGDAKWAYDPVAVTPGKSYTYSDYYQANIGSTLEIEYATSAGATSYASATAVPASASSWGTSKLTFTVPSGIATARVFHYITGVGWITLDDASMVAN